MAVSGLVQVERISKSYGRQLAVDGVSFSIAHGEIVGFVGPNGTGKSTTLRVLTGLITPDSGSVSLDGIDQRTDPTGFRARLGALIEAPAIYPMLSAFEHLAYVARMRRSFDRTRIENIGLRQTTQLQVHSWRISTNCSSTIASTSAGLTFSRAAARGRGPSRETWFGKAIGRRHKRAAIRKHNATTRDKSKWLDASARQSSNLRQGTSTRR